MDLSNIINNEKLSPIKNEFNSATFDFDNIKQDQLVNVADSKVVDVEKIQLKQQKQNMLKDLFSLLANSSQPTYIIKQLKTKYGTLVDDKVILCCMKLCDIIGNYIITCKYNDDLGHKNPTYIKYVMFCDCDGDDHVCNQVGQGSIDGFFKQNKKVVVSKRKICKKYNLPVLASIEDLTQEDFNQLAKKVSQVNEIQPKNNKKAKAITKIANVFNQLANPTKVIENNMKYAVKQANTQLVASVGNKMQYVSLTDLKNPVQKDFTVASAKNSVSLKDIENPKQNKIHLSKETKNRKINMPTNNVTVDVKQNKKAMDVFTITANKYDDLQLADVSTNKTQIMGKDMTVSVQKQAKYVENICIKPKAVDNGFDMKDDFVFDIENKIDQDFVIDTKNDFNF